MTSRSFPFCHFEGAAVGRDSCIGPYSRLRPGAELTGNNHIGNFVEVKKSVIGQDSKVNHLTYIGDADVGARVNVGAGTITCNYDGVNKFRTVIGDDAFIGSDTQLIAPVEVGAGATIGAGTTLTRNAAAGKLTLSRAPSDDDRGAGRVRSRSSKTERNRAAAAARRTFGEKEMCGIVAAASHRDVVPMLLEGFVALNTVAMTPAGSPRLIRAS